MDIENILFLNIQMVKKKQETAVTKKFVEIFKRNFKEI